MSYRYATTKDAPLQRCGQYGDECEQGTVGTGVPPEPVRKERIAERDAFSKRLRELRLQ